jgi:hypothetical protein
VTDRYIAAMPAVRLRWAGALILPRLTPWVAVVVRL